MLTDLRMEPVDGMAVIAGVKEKSPDTAVIVLTAYGDVPTAVAALQAGAAHYLTKPVNFDEVAHVVERTLAAAVLAQENQALRRAVRHLGGDAGLLGDAPATRKLRELIAKVAPSDATVLIRGESGAGKEVVARAIHAESGRRDDPFLAVNCAAIAESLLESELFGYRKGAFTGADSDREGLFEAARGGTVFLDEIGEAGPAVQAKLLRVLESRTINRVGDPRERQVDVRVVAATNRPLEQAIAAGTSARTCSTASWSSPSTCRRCASACDDIEAARPALPRPPRPPRARAARGGAAPAARARLAGQRPRAAQRARARPHPRRRRGPARRAHPAGRGRSRAPDASVRT